MLIGILSIMFKIQLIFFKLFFLFFKKGYPFGIIKWSTKKDYFEIYEKIIQKKYINIDNYENKIGYKIDKNWIDNLALHTQVVIKKSQINYQHGRVLYSELRNYIAINKLEKIIILETGTARGFSSVCMSKAISDSSIQGDIHTVDILPNNKKFFWNSVSDFEGPKTRSEILKEWLNYTHRIKFHTGNSVKIIKNLNLDRINFAFFDGSHNKE